MEANAPRAVATQGDQYFCYVVFVGVILFKRAYDGDGGANVLCCTMIPHVQSSFWNEMEWILRFSH